MDERRERFLARLRETFRVEAAEHIEGMTSGLISLEQGDDADRASVIERVFREAHSLKGAARAVNLEGAEVLCRELESVFAALKNDRLDLTPEMLDTLHGTMGVLSTLCDAPDAPAPPGVVEERKQALAALQTASSMAPAVDVRPAPVSAEPAGEPAAPGPPGEPPMSQTAGPKGAPDTVRVSARKLGTILLEAEELTGAKITALERSHELQALVNEVEAWDKRRARQVARPGRRQEGTEEVRDLLESEMLHTRTIENSLRRLAGSVHQDAVSLASVADRLLEDMRTVLLLPCSHLFGALPVIVRELAREQRKEVEIVLIGEGVEIDRRVLDELKDPLTHLLRNCVDHGVEAPDVRRRLGKPERGTITVSAESVEGNRVRLTVSDDGSGVDSDLVKKSASRLGILETDDAELIGSEVAGLLFHSGLTTSPIITDLSGRGLGLAIVREKVEGLGGTVSVSSTPGAGTAFELLVPVTLSTFRGVIVSTAGRRFAIPTANVVRVGRVDLDEVKTVENRTALVLEERPVSLARLRDILGVSGPDGRANGGARPWVLVSAAGRQVAFLVDEVLGEQEVVVKGLGAQLARVRNVSGACVLGTGAVVPILNAPDLVDTATATGFQGLREPAADAPPKHRGRVMIAEDSITARTLVKSILESGGYEVVAAVDGVDAYTKLKTDVFDLVVTDVDMPRMNGFELTARIRSDEKLKELPVVLVTALGSQQDREYGIEVGADAYIVKADFDQSNLLETVKRLL